MSPEVETPQVPQVILDLGLDPTLFPDPETLEGPERIARLQAIRSRVQQEGDDIPDNVVHYGVLLIRASRREGAAKRGNKAGQAQTQQAMSLSDF